MSPYGRHTLEGCGYSTLPATAGEKMEEICTWKPVGMWCGYPMRCRYDVVVCGCNLLCCDSLIICHYGEYGDWRMLTYGHMQEISILHLWTSLWEEGLTCPA